MKKLIILVVVIVAVFGGAWFTLHWFVNSDATLPAATEADFAKMSKNGHPTDAQLPQTAVAAPLMDPGERVQLAVGSLGAGRDESSRALADVLTAELSGTKGVVLVERASLDKVLTELHMSLSGLVRAGDATKVGKFLKADWFLLAARSSLGGSNTLVARIVESRTGVLRDVAVVTDRGDRLALAKDLADFVKRARQAASKPALRSYLAVGQFADLSVSSRPSEFPDQLRAFLTQAYANSSYTLLERDQVEALLQEVRLDLAGLTADSAAENAPAPLLPAFWVVQGYFQSYESSAGQVDLVLQVNQIFGRPTRRNLKGQAGPAFFANIKARIDADIAEAASRPARPGRLSEVRLQMEAGQQLYTIATGYPEPRFLSVGLRDATMSTSPEVLRLRARNLEEAIKAYQAVLLLEPGNDRAKYGLAACHHDIALGRYDEARNYLRELSESADYGWSRNGLVALGRSYQIQDPKEAAKWFSVAAERSKDKNDADWAKARAEESMADSIERQSRRSGSVPTGGADELIKHRLYEYLKGCESVLRGKGGVIDVYYGLSEFADRFGKNRKAAGERIAALLPELQTNFPALAPYLVGAALSQQVTNTTPLLQQFRLTLAEVAAHSDQLLDPPRYFDDLRFSAWSWAMKKKVYDLAAEIGEARQTAAARNPKIKVEPIDRVRLGFAYAALERWGDALAVYQALGDKPIVMQTAGPWGRAFDPVLPAALAADCRARLGGSGAAQDERQFTLGEPSLKLREPAVMTADGDAVWVALGPVVFQLGSDLRTNTVVPVFAARVTALCGSPNTLWIGTDQGLAAYDKTNHKLRWFNSKNGLLMDAVCSLHCAFGRVWIGFGTHSNPGEIGGFGSLQLDSETLVMCPAPLPTDPLAGGNAGAEDAVTAAPRHPVTCVVAGAPQQVLICVDYAASRRYDLRQDKWSSLGLDKCSVSLLCADSRRVVAGLDRNETRLDIEGTIPAAGSSPATVTNCTVSPAVFDKLRADPAIKWRVRGSGNYWQPCIAISDLDGQNWEFLLTDAALQTRPTALCLSGTKAFVGGNSYLAVVDLEQKTLRKLCRHRSQRVDSLLTACGDLWVQVGGNVYRVPLANL